MFRFSRAVLTAGLTGTMIGVAVPAWAASTPPGTNEQGYCTPEPQGDNVHASGGDASGHGWWLEGSCTAPYATVTVQLYEGKYSEVL